jgi:hypothetical protein
MGRPAMRAPGGRWSLAQVAAHAQVTHRVARTCVQAGYLDPQDLRQGDVTVLKVAAALLDAPRPAGPRTETSDAADRRNRQALTLTRQVLAAPERDAVLVVVPAQAHLARGLALVGLLAEHRTQPVLLLPVGEWAMQAAEPAAPVAPVAVGA